jgi:hypothetical protein
MTLRATIGRSKLSHCEAASGGAGFTARNAKARGIEESAREARPGYALRDVSKEEDVFVGFSGMVNFAVDSPYFFFLSLHR